MIRFEVGFTWFQFVRPSLIHKMENPVSKKFILVSSKVKVPLCQVDLAQTINEWKDVQSNKEDDQVREFF